jgi:predicted NBD/HSP70 family sugar kinase
MERHSMIINKILDVLLEKYDIEEEDVDKVKKILDKVSFTKRDGKNVMLITIGEGIELSIVQKEE